MTDPTPITPVPTPLSSAAQAVLDAYGHCLGSYEARVNTTRPGAARLAAALGAAADQIAPTKQNYSEASDLLAATCLNGMAYAANELRLIATELKGHA